MQPVTSYSINQTDEEREDAKNGELTDEQQKVVTAVMNGYNVIVNSVAGSGKTSVSLEIARSLIDKFLLITYNKRLKLETRNRVKKLCISNVCVTNYHSFCTKFYGSGKDDTEMRNVIINNTDPMLDFSFDYIIIDEAQDMTELYYFLVRKIINDNKKKIKSICVLGDKRQLLYDYKGADYRFLTKANECYNIDKIISKKWTTINITESFRISIEMANFINKAMFNQEIIRSNKHSSILPKYIVYNRSSSKHYKGEITQEILSLILTKEETTQSKYDQRKDQVRQKRGLYRPKDIMILMKSVPKETGYTNDNMYPGWGKVTIAMKTVIDIYTELQRVGIPINIPILDSETNTYDYSKDRLNILTFHQSKGIERKVVFVFCFDKSYESTGQEITCPNALYVAATRAIQKLYLIHEKKNDYLSFVSRNQLAKTTSVIGEIDKKCYSLRCDCPRVINSQYCKFHSSCLCIFTCNDKWGGKLKKCIYTSKSICPDCSYGSMPLDDTKYCFIHRQKKAKNVTDLLKHIDDKRIYKCIDHTTRKVISNKKPGIDKHINGPGCFGEEPLYDIFGTVIPMYYFYKKFRIIKEILRLYTNVTWGGNNRVIDIREDDFGIYWSNDLKETIRNILIRIEKGVNKLGQRDSINSDNIGANSNYIQTISQINESNSEPLITVSFKELFNLYHFQMFHNAIIKRHDFRYKQVKNHDYIHQFSQSYLRNYVSILDKEIKGQDIDIEMFYTNQKINGRIDCIDNTNKIIYEIKCKQSIDDKDIVQLALYKFILSSHCKYTDYKYRIININTSEVIEIACDDPKKIFQLVINRETLNTCRFNRYSDLTIDDCIDLASIY